MPYHY
jgi:ribosomal protein RSM22 (predicted rRNA methylase)